MSDTLEPKSPLRALGFLCSAIRCGDEWGDLHEAAAETIRAALGQEEANARRYKIWAGALCGDHESMTLFERLMAKHLPDEVGVERKPTVEEWAAAIDAADAEAKRIRRERHDLHN